MEDIKRRNYLRYRLHSKIRKQGFHLITKEKTIYFPFGKEIPQSKHLARLTREFGYAIQLHYE